MPVLYARLLGPPQFELDGRPLELSAGKARALLCYLVATRQVHSRDRLAGFFWPDVPERNALASLRTALYDVRRVLGPAGDALFVERTRVAFQRDASHDLDVATLEQISPEHGEGAAPALEAAVQAYRGPFLEGLSLPDAADFDDWVFLERERLANLYLSALVRLADLHARAGDWDRAVDMARRVLAVDALREDVHRQLMRYFARSGQRSAAVAQYRACVEVLDRELGIQPLPGTTELYERILAGESFAEEAGGPAPVVRAAQARSAPPAQLTAAAAPLVGRRDELAVLTAAWGRAMTGHGGVALVTGDAGLGKTRLVSALADEAVAGGALCWVGRSHEAGASQPYGPMVELLRSGLAQVDVLALGMAEVWLRELARLVPELAHGLSHGENVPLDGVRDRDRLFESFRALLSAVTAERPVLAVVEDIHWADDTSLSLLAYLARQVAGLPILLVATCRSTELGADQRNLVRQLAVAARRVNLAPLSEAETARLVGRLAEGDLPPARFGRRVHEATGGNPFFVVETIRALFEQGTLCVEGGRWTVPAAAEADDYAGLPVPETVALIVDGRLEQLPDDARTLLESAAVLRRDFAFDLAQAVSGVPASPALDALDTLVRLGLLRERQDGDGLAVRYDFSHALVRDRVYQSLTGARRQYLHRQIAGRIESMVPVAPDRVAYHYLRGGVRDRASAWSQKAGEAALAVYAFEGAGLHFRTARELAVTAAEEYRALAGQGDSEVGLGRPDAAIACFTAALAVSPDAVAKAELLRRIGRAHERQGAYDRALDAFAAARQLLPGKPTSAVAVRLADGLATVYVRLGRYAEAADLCRESLAWVHDHPDAPNSAEAEAWVRNTLGMAFLHGGDYPQALTNLQRSLDVKRQLGDRLGEATLLNNLGVVHYHCGEDALARDYYGASLAIKQAIGDSYGAAIALTNLALSETHLGEYEPAGQHLAEAQATAGLVGASWLMPEIHRVAAQRCLALDDRDGALRAADTALAAAEALGVPAFIGVAHRVLGQVKAAGFGDTLAADEHFATSLAVFEMLDNDHELAKTHAAYGEVLVAGGRATDASDHLRTAVAVFRRSGAHGRLQRIESLLGDP